ncbi:acyl-CoA dehydrogenase [Rhizobium sp. HT1-10]|uniref:acyl-CoA dehydrogenase n=1 Tax=Rhizobium sp. HT1-10 TaxID=3111638 RepID=UPI003C17317F
MYKAPVAEIAFTLSHVVGSNVAIDTGEDGELTDDLVNAILAEAARFAENEIAPLAEVGDFEGARLIDGAVRLAEGWPQLYRDWAAGGWNGLTASPEFGGQGLPQRLNVATLEIWNAASMAFGLAPTLTMGAIEALSAHGSTALKESYLARMISGEWTGTMNLTEPQAGSDVGALTARAERNKDGSYRIFGQKIYITWGDHDAADNIIHLVLARLSDAPPGTRGISLFLVPKFMVEADGSLGARNDLFCHSLEHKLGIHGSPTCTMIYGDGRFGETPGAIGWLVGEENHGLACMFTMMNNARLAVAMQGVGICEAATQKALAYARERRQGRAAGQRAAAMSPIVDHPDVARMLLTMKALTKGARAITYACAHAIDLSHGSVDTAHWQARAALLTPVAKAFATDCGVDVASLGIQVHGGMGYIEETGAARLWRDARIAPIYEGTNGIQAIDLVTRKLPLGGGAAVRGLIDEMQAIATAVENSAIEGLGATAGKLQQALADLTAATEWLLAMQAEKRIEEALAGATPYLRLFGLSLTGCYLAKGALADAGDGAEEGRIALAAFAAQSLLGETAGLKDQIVHGATSLLAARIALD